ncbi:MAG: glucans biosynthesis glucosyltransferase MdoH, partial [Pseudomonadota bacterium]
MARALLRRRLLVLALNATTITALCAIMLTILMSGGISITEVVMLVTFLVTLPWLSIGFWNAIIGLTIVARGASANDPLKIAETGGPITKRTAIVMALRNEAVDEALPRVRAMYDKLVASGLGDVFDVHVLSDTNEPATAAREEAFVAAWRADSERAGQIFYRRRADNTGYKAGNIGEFVDRCADQYEYFMTLDADSYVEPALLARLVRMMDAEPGIGILQTLAVGMPSGSFFTRVFQFGMRHGMRAYTHGAVWWSGDCGPYWGHNALIRTVPFRDHCRLPILPGDGPLGGHIMSHDQVEAVMMRRAGYPVRVLVEEGESFEENPPTLPDFIRRELRWCQGNMQYFSLLGMDGLKPMSRMQLFLAILMYCAPAAWIAFMVAGVAGMFVGGVTIPGTEGAEVPAWLGYAMLGLVLFMNFAPKILGVVSVLLNRRTAAQYGGRPRVLAGAAVELMVSMLMAPVVAFAIAIFAAGLVFGRKIDWRAQPRGGRTVDRDEAGRAVAPHTLLGRARC